MGVVGEGVTYVSCLCIEEEAMSLSIFYYCICDFPCRWRRFEPTSYHLSPINLSYVAVSRSCRLSEFNPNRASQSERLLFQRPLSRSINETLHC